MNNNKHIQTVLTKKSYKRSNIDPYPDSKRIRLLDYTFDYYTLTFLTYF